MGFLGPAVSFLIDMTKLCPLSRKVENGRGKERKVWGREDSCSLHLGILEFQPSFDLISLHFLDLELKMLQNVPGTQIAASTDMMLFSLYQGIILIFQRQHRNPSFKTNAQKHILNIQLLCMESGEEETGTNYSVSGALLGTLCLPHLILPTTLSFSCYQPPFISEENEVLSS